MEVSSLNGLQKDDEKAGRNSDLAGLILCEMQGIHSLVSTDQSNNKVKNDETLGSSYVKTDQPVSAATNKCSGNRKKDELMESSCCNSFQSSCQANGDLRSPTPVSKGTVSSMLGKGYMKSVPLANGSYAGTKPMKVDSNEMPIFVLG
uniref:Uncharacterized protein n=1 Tax=Gossypium raimondii TaxID=29730 RepID=A0A0D2PYF4_GOSRA|nr:hypothetical protein B456_002G215200 [Gossypium raimondii]